MSDNQFVAQRSTPYLHRSEPPEIAELRRLREMQPELATAVDLQIALLQLQRRIQARIPVSSLRLDAPRLQEHLAAGQPLLRFEDLPLDWSDFRLVFRETADLLRRHDLLGEEDYRRVQLLAQDRRSLEPLVSHWYRATDAAAGPPDADLHVSDVLEQTILLAMRPFLARCADSLLPGVDLSAWRRPHCPLCGGEAEFAAITPSAERLLICGRCTGQWGYDPVTCPFCGNADRGRITSFASRDRCYRIYACDVCRRYLKAYDGRRARRPVMLTVDSTATLPLDAAAMQKGYRA